MDSFAKPLRQLHEDAVWFARAAELRALHVTCSTALRSAAIETLAQTIEFHPDNKCPVLVLEDPWLVAGPGWRARAQRMVELWEGRVRVLAEHGLELGTMSGQRPASPDAFGAFGGWVNLLLQALRPPLEGLAIVLAPTRIEDADAFEAELLELVRQPELEAARWVVVEAEEAPLARLHEQLGEDLLHSVCLLDDGAFAADLDAMVSSIDPEGTGPARAGAAWPRGVVPPVRVGEPEPPTPEQQKLLDATLEASGVNPALAGPLGARMQQHVMAAAVYLKQGNGSAALEHQKAAVGIASEAGARQHELLMRLVLGGYYLALEHHADAREQYTAVASQAEAGDLWLEHAQARLALALMDAREEQHAPAAAHYAAAADAAVRAETPSLAIECWRLAGQMAAEADLESRAVECFQRAIDLAEGAEPDVAATSSAPKAARQLAARLRAQGLEAQAASLEQTAGRLEEGMPRSTEAMLS